MGMTSCSPKLIVIPSEVRDLMLHEIVILSVKWQRNPGETYYFTGML